jgi:hypothetical protein
MHRISEVIICPFEPAISMFDGPGPKNVTENAATNKILNTSNLIITEIANPVNYVLYVQQYIYIVEYIS